MRRCTESSSRPGAAGVLRHGYLPAGVQLRLGSHVPVLVDLHPTVAGLQVVAGQQLVDALVDRLRSDRVG